ncbi:hypothetical protein C2S52_005088 [Perilla frutescens var. hirtella]|nr:hypothetical protein C2S52_005088 [Perilla frutescens var. hirtella]
MSSRRQEEATMERLGAIIFQTMGMSDAEARRLESAAIFILKNTEVTYFVGHTVLGLLLVRGHNADYNKWGGDNVRNFLGLKLMALNMVNLEDFLLERVKMDEISDDGLKELINQFMDYYISDININMPRFPNGTWKSRDRMRAVVEQNLAEVEIHPDSDVEGCYYGGVMAISHSRCCCFCLEEFVTGSKVALCESCHSYLHTHCALLWILSSPDCWLDRRYCMICRKMFVAADAEFPEWISNIERVRGFLQRTQVVDGDSEHRSKNGHSKLICSTTVAVMFNRVVLEFLDNIKLEDVAAAVKLHLKCALIEKALILLKKKGNDADNVIIKNWEKYLLENFGVENVKEAFSLEEDRFVRDEIFYFFDMCKEVTVDSDAFLNLFVADFMPRMLRALNVPAEDLAKFEIIGANLLIPDGLTQLKRYRAIHSVRQVMTPVEYVNLQKEKKEAWQTTMQYFLHKSFDSNVEHFASEECSSAPLAEKAAERKKAAAFEEVVKRLNNARKHDSPFKPASDFKAAYESLKLDSSGAVSMLDIWHLIMALIGEDRSLNQNVSKRMSLVVGARRHLEWKHFMNNRDAGDARRQPPSGTTWAQIYFFLRIGRHDNAEKVASTSPDSQKFASLLSEWIDKEGMISEKTAAAASEECENILQMVTRVGWSSVDKKKLLLHAMISGSRDLIKQLLRKSSTFFDKVTDWLWFALSAVRESSGDSSSSAVLNGRISSYCLEDLQLYVNALKPSHYTVNGTCPLVYPYALLLSIQLLPGIVRLGINNGDGGYYSVDTVHIAIVLADYGVLSEGSGSGQKFSVTDALADASSIIRQYGTYHLERGDLLMALEYYVQAAAVVGGGQLSWIGRASVDQQRQRTLMFKRLLTEILLRDGGISLLLGSRGAGEEGELGRFLTDRKVRKQFLLEAARQSLYLFLQYAINMCLSEALCALSHGSLEVQSRITGLVQSGNKIIKESEGNPKISEQEGEILFEQQNVLTQLHRILAIRKLVRSENQSEALSEISRLPFFPLDLRSGDFVISPHVEACVPGLVKDALKCLVNFVDADGSRRVVLTEIARFATNNLNPELREWFFDQIVAKRL